MWISTCFLLIRCLTLRLAATAQTFVLLYVYFSFFSFFFLFPLFAFQHVLMTFPYCFHSSNQRGTSFLHVHARESVQLKSVVLRRLLPENYLPPEGSNFDNFDYCSGSEFLLSPWSLVTLCSSYSSTVSSARRLILLYDFLSQGEGGKLPFSSAVHMNPSAPVLSTESLIKFFPFFNKYDASYSVLYLFLFKKY